MKFTTPSQWLSLFLSNRNYDSFIPHRRELTLKFKNGNQYCIGFV